MSSHGRTIRSGSSRSNAVPAPSRPSTSAAPVRPELHVVSESASARGAVANGITRLVVWTRSRSTSLIHIVIAAVFLAATLVGALVLRTQMVENSFEAASVQANINTLTQDVEEDQAKLDALESSLPAKAEEMGMVLQQGSLSIDLSGYQAPGTDTSSTGKTKTNAKNGTGSTDGKTTSQEGNTQ
ncbi:hypothetical protein [Bifidobacterium sp. SO1]|uniref:hypothetical protein n=1 Tax=Bifidobacterium sp. SO1 TaxID=2809029 RepID=UPI001F0A9BFE|nr:hypothetical protein [Bifidobacterium sp. SO1]